MTSTDGRSPHGERGLKFECQISAHLCRLGRSPHGERGLKSPRHDIILVKHCRSPHGERGLKFNGAIAGGLGNQSLSSWRAWIEITVSTRRMWARLSRSPHGERGLKCP